MEQCELGRRKGLVATLGNVPTSQAAWEQALVPIRLGGGGLGLCSPATVRTAARLVALVNIREKALALGANPEHLRVDFEAAVEDMCADLGVGYLPDLNPGKELRATLCEPLHRRRLHALVEKATGGDQQRLVSQSTSHVNSWSVALPPSERPRRSTAPGCVIASECLSAQRLTSALIVANSL